MADMFSFGNFMIVALIALYMVTASTIVVRLYIKHRDMMFDVNMKMAEAQASAANPLKFDDIKRIIEGIIINTSIMEIILNGYAKLTSAELSLLYDDIVEDIAVKTENYLSPELIRQWEKFASEEYRTKFIIFTVRVSFLAQCRSEASKLRHNQINSFNGTRESANVRNPKDISIVKDKTT